MQQNFLSPTGFRLTIKRLPHVQFFVQSAQVPGVSIGSTDSPTPFKSIHFAGDKVNYGDFNLTIRVDEYMESYNEIYEWMAGLAKPVSFDQYKDLKDSDYGLYSDASLVILDSKQNPALEVTMYNIFPIELGPVTLDTTQTGGVYATCDITFKTNGHKVSKITR